MDRLLTALTLCALPAAAAAQQVNCVDCAHMASWFRGEGGFIGTVAPGVDEVTFVASCGSVTITGQAQVHGDTASRLFNHRNGLACDREDGSLQIAGLVDGGWFWITDEKNSAIGLLVNREVHEAVKDDAIRITSAGDGVTMATGMGAVYLKETATGRVGILPNILPKKPPTPLRPCGFTGSGASARKLAVSCQLGDGAAFGYMSGTNTLTGGTTRIPDGGAITRPAGDSTTTYYIYGWMKPGGHIAGASVADARRGHGQFASGPPIPAPEQRLHDLSARASAGADGPFGTRLTLGAAKWGVTVTTSGFGAKVEVAADTSFCSTTNNVSLPLAVELVAASDAVRDQVIPRIKAIAPVVVGESTAGGNVIVTRNQFTIVCPAGSGAASAHQGRELPPDNPFPVE